MELIQENHQERSAPAKPGFARGLRRHVDAFIEAASLPERMDAIVALGRWSRHGWGAAHSPSIDRNSQRVLALN
jgi:hypothetical protein